MKGVELLCERDEAEVAQVLDIRDIEHLPERLEILLGVSERAAEWGCL